MIRILSIFALLLSVPANAGIAKAGRIDTAAAQTITDTCIAFAARSGWNVHLAVLNEYGDLMRFVGMDGATRTSGVLALGKANTVYRTGRTTREVAKMDSSAQAAFQAVAIPGGLPVLLNGRLVGVVASSGAKPEDDETCAQAGIDAAM